MYVMIEKVNILVNENFEEIVDTSSMTAHDIALHLKRGFKKEIVDRDMTSHKKLYEHLISTSNVQDCLSYASTLMHDPESWHADEIRKDGFFLTNQDRIYSYLHAAEQIHSDTCTEMVHDFNVEKEELQNQVEKLDEECSILRKKVKDLEEEVNSLNGLSNK